MLVPALLALTAITATRSASLDEGEEFFEAKIRPLLIERCFECHGGGKHKGGLALDTREGWQRGGANGAALVPGDPDASLLVRALRYADLDLQMPPKGKLAQREIELFVEWVRRGAPDPRVAERAAGAEGAAAADANAQAGASAADAPAGASAAEAPRHWDAAALRAAREHWAFRPIAHPAPPQPQGRAWCANEIDAFVLAGLEAKGLQPAPEADRRTLLRRASFELIGLPPSEAEYADFERDLAPGAWERVVDRLLASPHYGERQARRWLDLARYADSNGLDENLAIASAWRYRDWVVEAFNRDLPYDQFATQQLAGDLLPEPADAHALEGQLVATGFLVLGPKMLAEQDKDKLAIDVVDEQLDVSARAFLGLTLGCARCHDHKFDPLTQRDYTAVAGVFRSTRTMGDLAFVSAWNQRELAPRARIEQRAERARAAEAAEAALAELRTRAEREARAELRRDTPAYLLAATRAAAQALVLEAEDASRTSLITDASEYGNARHALVRTGKAGEQFAEYDLAVEAAARKRLWVRYAAEEARPVRVTLDGKLLAERALAEPTGGWRPDRLRWVEVATLELAPGRNVLRLEGPAAFPHVDTLLLVPAASDASGAAWPAADAASEDGRALEPAVVRAWALELRRAERQPDPLLAAWSAFARLDSADFAREAPRVLAELEAAPESCNPLVLAALRALPPQSLRELAGRYGALCAAAESAWEAELARPEAERRAQLADAGLDAFRERLYGAESPLQLEPEQLEVHLPPARAQELAAARASAAEARAAVGPAFERALAVAEADAIVDLPIFARGNHLNPVGTPVPRGAPQLFDELVPAPAIEPAASGRLAFARWLVQPEHPLTARVIANRIWQAHFGSGLVRSASNFGLRGDRPSHPELLDWLARSLQADGWSLKALHKRIVLSAAYRQSSVSAPEASGRGLALDPENRLLWRQNRRRLEAEELRDALLAVSGQLDHTLGGSLLGLSDRAYVTNDQSAEQARYDSPRRSLYLPVIRNAIFDLFASFDYADPSVPLEARVASAAPQQALWMMNSPLALECARRAAAAPQAADASAAAGVRAEAVAESSASAEALGARIELVYRRVLARAPSARELARACDFAARLAEPPAPAAEPTAGARAPSAHAESASTDAQARRERALAAFAQVLLQSNEFLYVD